MNNRVKSCETVENIKTNQTSASPCGTQSDLRFFSHKFFSEIPSVLSHITSDYRRIVSDAPLDDIKKFAACHLAGRAALLHMLELLRLADRLAARVDAEAGPLAESDLDDLLRQARLALRDFAGEEVSL